MTEDFGIKAAMAPISHHPKGEGADAHRYTYGRLPHITQTMRTPTLECNSCGGDDNRKLYWHENYWCCEQCVLGHE